MRTTVVRYKTFPQHADENAALIAQVFMALERQKPPGLRYQAMRGRDGVTFTHVAQVDDSLADHPLTSLPEFQAFVAGIRGRCVDPPAQVDSTEIGHYPN
jgi:hypothetical protein